MHSPVSQINDELLLSYNDELDYDDDVIEEDEPVEGRGPSSRGGGVVGPLIGPRVPDFLKNTDSGSDNDDEDSNGFPRASYSFGPSLPPEMVTMVTEPPSESDDIPNDDQSASCSKEHKDACSDSEKDIDDDVIIGPTLPSLEDFVGYEQRLHRLKQIEAIQDKSKKRESWMTDLPSTMKKTIGLSSQPKGFSKKATVAEVDKSWTESPLDKMKKDLGAGECAPIEESNKHMSKESMKKRDEHMEKRAKKLGKNRQESLMDQHANKRKKLDESEFGKRKPFNREEDLKIVNLNKMDPDKLAERAQALTGRFSHGTGQRYL